MLWNKELEKIVTSELKKLSSEITKLNQEQLLKGLLPSGKNTPLYSPLTIQYKKELSYKEMWGDGIHWSLKESGDLFSKMKVERTLFGGHIYSDSSHVTEIRELLETGGYGLKVTDFFGLTKENKDYVLNKLSINTIESIKKYLYGMS